MTQDMNDKPSDFEARCSALGLKMTDQRRVIARVLGAADDHPDVEEVYHRATTIDPRISLATVYRALRLFADVNLLERHDFRGGRSRYEAIPEEHHDHLIDVESGAVIEFQDSEIEQLQRAIAEKLGYKLIDHRLELYGVPVHSKKKRKGE
jgi:Fur family ferric uptake transcriptional regulator